MRKFGHVAFAVLKFVGRLFVAEPPVVSSATAREAELQRSRANMTYGNWQ